MENYLKLNSEGNLQTKQNEDLTFRVYSDGFVRIEGSNVCEEFNTIDTAFSYIQKNKIKLINIL